MNKVKIHAIPNRLTISIDQRIGDRYRGRVSIIHFISFGITRMTVTHDSLQLFRDSLVGLYHV